MDQALQCIIEDIRIARASLLADDLAKLLRSEMAEGAAQIKS